MARCVCPAAVMAAITACGGGPPGTAAPVVTPPPPATYTVAGTVTGLSGSGLVLSVLYTSYLRPTPSSFVITLPVSAAGTFTFGTRVAGDTAYSVGVEAQPSSPLQYCSAGNASGIVAAANVTNVSVTCGNGYTAGGTVSGLVGSGLELQIAAPGYGRPEGASSPLYIDSDGAFTFDLVYPGNDSSGTFVRINRQPASPTQRCVIRNAAIVVQAANVTDVEVVCSQFSYVANAGDNTVSAYTVNATSGALAAVGTPVATGTSPHAIVGTQDYKYVFVGNEGSNDISAFAVNSASGALTAVPGSPFAAGTAPKALAIFGAYLYVANAGSDNLSAYAIDTSTGSLTPLLPASFATGKGPSSIAVDPSGAFIYVANHGGSNNISAFSIDGATGLLTEIAGSPFAAGGSPLSLAFGAAGKFLYAANSGVMNSSISGFSVDPLSGALTALSGSPFPLAVSNGIATDGTGAYLYVTTGTTVAGYRIDATTGLLTSLTGFPVAAGANAYAVTLDPTNQFLYVANDGATNISGFRLDASTGGVTPIAGSPFAAGNSPDSLTTL
jgi:6-phosphogluconolactonase